MSNVLFTTYAAGTTGTITFGAAIASQVPVVAKTGNYSVQSTDASSVLTTVGTTTEVTFTLPAATVGNEYTFLLENNYGLIISAPGGATMRIGEIASSSGGTLTTTDKGSSVTLVAVSTTEWIATSSTGSWVAA
jgi:hypothetical protein